MTGRDQSLQQERHLTWTSGGTGWGLRGRGNTGGVRLQPRARKGGRRAGGTARGTYCLRGAGGVKTLGKQAKSQHRDKTGAESKKAKATAVLGDEEGSARAWVAVQIPGAGRRNRAGGGWGGSRQASAGRPRRMWGPGPRGGHGKAWGPKTPWGAREPRGARGQPGGQRTAWERTLGSWTPGKERRAVAAPWPRPSCTRLRPGPAHAST